MAFVIVSPLRPLVTAQEPTPGTLDLTFKPALRGTIGNILLQSDGRMLVSGGFYIEGNPSYTRLTRLTQDAAYDPSFAPTSSAPSQISALAFQPDGKLLVGSGSERIKRYYPDGSLDPGLRLNLPTPDPDRLHCCHLYASALTVQSDGKILAAGRRLYRGSDEIVLLDPELYRLWPDGSMDPSFTPLWATVHEISILPDQAILIAGDGLTQLHPDGTRNTNFMAGPFLPNNVQAFAVQADGRIVIGGYFTNVQGHARSHLARLWPDGELDTSFNPPPSTSVYSDYAVLAIAIQTDGRILVGGYFDTMGGFPYGALARLNADGTLDESFQPISGLQEDGEGGVHSIVIQDETRAIVGGVLDDGRGLFRVHLGGPSPRLSAVPTSGGALQLSFYYSGDEEFNVVTATDLAAPALSWVVLGSPANKGDGLYQFTDPIDKSEPQRFYKLRSAVK